MFKAIRKQKIGPKSPMNSMKNTSETSGQIFHSYPKTSLSIAFLISAIIVLAVFEIALRMLGPISITNVGYINTPNGLRYGWGFKPYDLVRIEDPDTGKVSFDRVNNKGWRDRDRTYKNPKNAFRVVILGDSETFGYIVPKNKTFTWLLEDRLKAEGMNIEILNISYSGWGTSQQLEALEKEGMKYRPDLVIINFSGNDVTDNIIHTDPGKFGARIPFFHEISSNGQLERRDNPRFDTTLDRVSRQYILSKSEILKRLWLAKQTIKYARSPPHVIASGQINLLNTMLAGKMSKRFQTALERALGREMDLSELKEFLDDFELDKNTHKAIVRITENRGFQRQFHGAQGLYKKAGLSYDHWPLFKKLMERIRDVATNGGAQVMIASDYGPGLSKWMRDWYRAPPGNKTKNLFSMNNRRLRSLANSIGIKFIEPSKNDERARNDPHLNETGHLDKANNLYEFLMGAFGNEIRSR